MGEGQRERERRGGRNKEKIQDTPACAFLNFYFFASDCHFLAVIADISCVQLAKPFVLRCELSESCCLNCFPTPFFSHLSVMANPHFSIFIPCQLHVAANSYCWPMESLDPNHSFMGIRDSVKHHTSGPFMNTSCVLSNALLSRPMSAITGGYRDCNKGLIIHVPSCKHEGAKPEARQLGI